MGDADGFKRGARGIDGNKGADFIKRGPPDDGFKAPKHDVVDLGTRENMFTNSNWKVGALPKGGEPRFAPKGDSGTHQRGPNDMTCSAGDALKPSGKYAKKGGRGKGFGS